MDGRDRPRFRFGLREKEGNFRRGSSLAQIEIFAFGLQRA